jgi:sulfide:quinone oxidoreductase
MPSRSKILIAGGGVAGLEAALALKSLAGERVEVEMLTARRDLLYRPTAVGEPFRTASVGRYDLAELAERGGFGFNQTSLRSVDPEKRRAVPHDGGELDYDFLIVATGARPLWSIPGATMFWGGPDELDSELVVERLRDEEIGSLAFALPSGRTWSLPLYELALLTEANLATEGGADRPRLVIVTPEERPLGVFGPRVSDAVAALLEQRGIDLVAGAHPVKYEGGRLSIVPGDPIAAEAVIAFPAMCGREVEGIPHDEDGFIPTDDRGRIQGLSHAYAAGDVTTFPVKQGGIASQQADAIAESIAAEVGAEVEPRPFDPVLRGVLWTGEGRKYLFAEIAGGHGETSDLTDDPPWSEGEGKIVSRYLSPFLAEA